MPPKPAHSLAIVLGVAALFRLLVFLQIHDSPILYLHHWTETDNAFYDGWARKIVAGDRLSVDDVRPYHVWHARVAREAYEQSGGRQPFNETLGRRIWDEWLKPRTFYQDPLYPYLLAALYAPFGRHVGFVFVTQALLGLGCVALLWTMTRRLFDDAVALVAGLMAALYAPLVLYENVLLRTALINTTGLVTLWLAIRAFREPSTRRFVLVGVAGSLAALTTSSAWLFVLALFPWLFALKDRLRLAAALAAGILVGLSPTVGRNLAVGVAPFSLASSGAVTFINHNAADYEPMSGTATSAHAADILLRTGGAMIPAVRETIRTHGGVFAWLSLVARKAAAAWTWYEIPNNESYDYFLMQGPAARWLGVTFGVIAPLALVGLILGFRRSWEYVLTVAYVGCCVFSLVILYTLGRLRVPVAFALIPFAALTIVTVVRWLRQLDLRPAVAALVAVVLASVFVYRPLPAGLSRIRIQDYGVGNEITLKRAEQEVAAGDHAHALALLTRQLQTTEPETLRTLAPTSAQTILSALDADLAGSFGPLHEMRGRLLAEEGKSADAEREERRAALLATIDAQRKASR